MRAPREMYNNKGSNNYGFKRPERFGNGKSTGQITYQTTYQSDLRSDMGKKIDIQDIVTYIEKNKKFIDAPKNDSLGFMEDDLKDIKIDPMHYNKIGTLENLPTNLSSVFGSVNNLKRLGVIHNVQVPTEIDISFVSSLFAVIIDDFIKMKESEQIEFTEIFIRRIHKESREKYIEYEYSKLGWELKEFSNNIKTFTIGKDILRYIADYLFINIFIIDVEADSLVYVGEKRFIKYKKNIFILKLKDSWFEPVLMSDIRHCEFNSSTIKKLVNSRFLVERLDCDFTNEKEEFNFIVGQDDLERFLPKIDEDEFIEKNNESDKNVSIANKNTSYSELTKDADLSDDLNGFEEHGDVCVADNIDHLSDDSDDNTDSVDIIVSTVKTGAKDRNILTNKKTVTKSKTIVKHSPIKSLKTSIKSLKPSSPKKTVKASVPKKSEKSATKEVKQEPKYSEEYIASKTVVQLKEILKEHNISTTYDRSGKQTAKTRSMLVSDVSTIMT